MRLVHQATRKIRLGVGLALVKLIDDAKKIQRMQVSLLAGEVRDDVNRYQDYGFTSHPKSGAQGVAIAIGGNRNHTALIRVDDPRYRKKDLQEGEVAVYHWEGDSILLKNGNEIEITSTSKITVTAPEVVVTASTKVTLDSPTVECTNDLHVKGNTTIDGNASAAGNVSDASGSMQEMRNTYNSHTNPSNGNAPPPQQMT
ncbi:MAG TPA: phage baseplate assembly protein V [Steroidobacteraceae bacterium]|nr:phage baseplate assembly protein V [Steroidobacteraceae bacterium]